MIAALLAAVLAYAAHLTADAGESMPERPAVVVGQVVLVDVAPPAPVVEQLPAPPVSGFAPSSEAPAPVVDERPGCAAGEEHDGDRCVAVQLDGERGDARG